MIPARWRYEPAASARDLRLDLLRGLCMAKMLFSHLWVTPLHTINNWVGFISAAEGFFLLSGATAGLVYRRLLARDGWGPTCKRLAGRALALYLANLGMVALHFALEAAGALPTARLWRPGWRWVELLAFDQPYFLQLLPRYALFLLVTPLALWLLARRRTPALLVACGVLYAGQLAAGGWEVPGLEHGEFNGSPLAAWQLLFFAGLAGGYHHERLARWWRPLPSWLAGGMSGLACLAFVTLTRLAPGRLPDSAGEAWFFLFDRDLLGPGRLLNVALALAFLFFLVDRLWVPVSRILGPMALPFGQYALTAFILHILVLTAANVLLLPHRPEILAHLGSILLLDAAAFLAIWWLARHRQVARLVPS